MPGILIADDDDVMHEMYRAVLEADYRLVATESGEDALMAAAADRPALIILDVEMPGIDGYETCRCLRRTATTSSVPVIFVSGHDGIEDRVRGYDAGGDDYVVKPFDAQELRAKTQRLLKAAAERDRFHAMASEANQSAMAAMADMSDAGALLQTLQRFNGCADSRSLADAMIGGLALLELKGVAQVRCGDVVTRSSGGDAGPLECSVIERLNEMDQVMQFRSSLSIRHAHVSLLVNNMPADNAERCERLHDSLTVLAEAADVRAGAIATAAGLQRLRAAAARAVALIGADGDGPAAGPARSRHTTAEAVAAFVDDMQQAYVSVALSTAQEEFMAALVSRGIENIIAAQRVEGDIRNRLGAVLRELRAAR